MKISIVYFIALCFGVTQASLPVPVLKEDIKPVEAPKIAERGLSG